MTAAVVGYIIWFIIEAPDVTGSGLKSLLKNLPNFMVPTAAFERFVNKLFCSRHEKFPVGFQLWTMTVGIPLSVASLLNNKIVYCCLV